MHVLLTWGGRVWDRLVTARLQWNERPKQQHVVVIKMNTSHHEKHSQPDCTPKHNNPQPQLSS